MVVPSHVTRISAAERKPLPAVQVKPAGGGLEGGCEDPGGVDEAVTGIAGNARGDARRARRRVAGGLEEVAGLAGRGDVRAMWN